jgi:hypothetical protein
MVENQSLSSSRLTAGWARNPLNDQFLWHVFCSTLGGSFGEQQQGKALYGTILTDEKG